MKTTCEGKRKHYALGSKAAAIFHKMINKQFVVVNLRVEMVRNYPASDLTDFNLKSAKEMILKLLSRHCDRTVRTCNTPLT